jgi:hypothetical protein
MRRIVYKNHRRDGWLAHPCQSFSRSGGRRFDPRAHHNILHKPTNQSPGAMWQPLTGPCGTLTTNHKLTRVNCRLAHVPKPYYHVNLPRQSSYCPVTFPHQLMTSPMPHVTLIVVTCVTSRLAQMVVRTSKNALHMSPPGAATCRRPEFPRQLYEPYGLHSQLDTWTVQTVQSSLFLPI